MPGLRHSLGHKDFSLLVVIADKWEIDVTAKSVDQLIDILVEKLVNKDVFNSHYSNLTEGEKEILLEIFHSEKRLPWSLFIRRFGEFRDMGVARISREQPYKHPVSDVEKLWYQGLIARDFFNSQAGIEEFVYIPDEFHVFLEQSKSPVKSIIGIPAKGKDLAVMHHASDAIVDLSCTLLAGIRAGVSDEEYQNHWEDAFRYARAIPIPDLKIILAATDLLTMDGYKVTSNIGEFLGRERGKAHFHLVHSYLDSDLIKEMELVPDFRVEGEWFYDPIETRKKVLNLLIELPHNKWWSLAGFISSVKSLNPDFMRSAGDYDSWLIRSSQTGEFLRGFHHWDDVEGKFLHFMITGPLNWLGLVDLASAELGKNFSVEQVAAFCFPSRALELINGKIPPGIQDESEQFLFRSNGTIFAPKGTPRSTRYQIARIADWGKMVNGGYTYQISAQSVSRAVGQGLSINQIKSILKSGSDQIPPSIMLAMERWNQYGLQTSIHNITVLRVSHPEIIQSLQKSKVSRYLGDPLGSAAIIIKPGGEEKLKSALIEMGFLTEFKID